ncbi:MULTISPECIES: hypothetical protein [unclassified Pseudoxanthomonas]|uniref:hypothetical protein n=1 Tax=unclassified Pseudoxanthomonas TaxID=2645906 RepID=UPI00307739D9
MNKLAVCMSTMLLAFASTSVFASDKATEHGGTPTERYICAMSSTLFGNSFPIGSVAVPSAVNADDAASQAMVFFAGWKDVSANCVVF